MPKSLIDLKKEEKGVIISFNGGKEMSKRLMDMGIRTGKTISRVSSQILRGPVILSIDGRQTAVGWGMASRVMVEPARNGRGSGNSEYVDLKSGVSRDSTESRESFELRESGDSTDSGNSRDSDDS